MLWADRVASVSSFALVRCQRVSFGWHALSVPAKGVGVVVQGITPFASTLRACHPDSSTRKSCVNTALVVVALGTALSIAAASHAQSAPDSTLTVVQELKIELSPIRLHGSNRQQQLLIAAKTAGGEWIDVTHRCNIVSSDPTIAAVSGAVVHGVRDGKTTITARFGAQTATVSAIVSDFAVYPPVDFANDVVPLFSKLGCNSGGCHGKASGQNGFKLSVFGFDPEADYSALVKEARGRRVLASAPEHSLLLLKPTGTIAHGGGRRLEVGSPDYVLVREWLKQGMPAGATDGATLVGLRVLPTERVLGLKADQQIAATAVFSDGSERDVTAAASYTSNAAHVAAVDLRGRVHTGSVPGEAAIAVHYMGQVTAARFQVPRPDAPNPYPVLPVNNAIDGYVWAKLKTMGLTPSELTEDAAFLRRLYFDTLGALPRPDEVRAFLADADPQKRAKWIDKVLERPEFADYAALRWADVLLVNRDKLGDRGAFELHRWLRGQMARNRPYDEWVRELLTASGSSARIGPVNFYRASATTEEITRSVSQAFLGIRLECAQCHHHPFEKWSQEDFYALAGFFNGMTRKKGIGDEEVVIHPGYRPMDMPTTKKPVAARPPGGSESPIEGDPRPRLAEWMTKPDNPWFARLAVNRLWKHYLGRGLVEPEDDLRSTNPAANEALLDYLAKSFVDHKYDLKAATRLILNSRVYQLSSVPNATNKDDEQHYSHHLVRRLPAEVLLDAISAATESPESFPGRPRGTRAVELWDNRMPSYFLDIFGRSERLSPCECGRSTEPTMAQCLHLMNAPEIERKLGDPVGRVERLLKERKNEREIVEELCLAALGRPAGDNDYRVARQLFEGRPRREGAQDFLWALLNSQEFLFVR
jgi:hypothetical protein